MTARFLALAFLVLLLSACSSSRDDAAIPARILLHYDFSGDWVATAGEECAERLGLSDSVFLAVAAVEGQTGHYYIADFFMLEPGEPAEAQVGTADIEGRLTLVVETAGVVEGMRANILYSLALEQETAMTIRLRGLSMAARDGEGRIKEVNLLIEATADPTIPTLGAAGTSGLCLQRARG